MYRSIDCRASAHECLSDAQRVYVEACCELFRRILQEGGPILDSGSQTPHRGSRQGDRCSRGRCIAQADDHSWHRPNLRHRDRRSSTAGRDLCQGPRLCRLTPLQRSTGGKQKLGATSKMGERTLRRLLIIGSSAVVQQASKRGAPKGSWLEQMLTRKPRMLVTVALANKMARIVWALLVKRENYRAPVSAKA